MRDADRGSLVMTASSEVSGSASTVAMSPLSILEADTLRTLLVIKLGDRVADTSRHTATFAAVTADSSGIMTSLDRAQAALHLYVARAALEEMEDAVARVDDGSYGICQKCDRGISFDRLVAMPEARLCSACQLPSGPSPNVRRGRAGASPGCHHPPGTRSPASSR